MVQIETELKDYTKGLELCKKAAAIRDKYPRQENDAACARRLPALPLPLLLVVVGTLAGGGEGGG